jgi:hypothetical protein
MAREAMKVVGLISALALGLIGFLGYELNGPTRILRLGGPKPGKARRSSARRRAVAVPARGRRYSATVEHPLKCGSEGQQ